VTGAAISRAIQRVEVLIEESKREQMVVLVSLTDDPEEPGHGLGWERAYALEDDELQRRYEADDDASWELAESEHHEAYDEETGKQAAYGEVLAILREEANEAAAEAEGEAIRAALDGLSDMSTDEFARGADRPLRDHLARSLGYADADAYYAAKGERP
jgi:hypothetical protein